jgi:hypothetical protein
MAGRRHMAMKQTATSDTTHQRIPDITADGHRMVRLPEVIKATGLPRSTIYKLMAAGEFPARDGVAALRSARMDDPARRRQPLQL